MDRPSPEIVDCPHCGAKNASIDDACAHCGRGLTLYIGPPPKVRRVNLGSMMALIAATAVGLAPARTSPMGSVVLLALLVPATLRTVIGVESRKMDERPMNRSEVFESFMNSCVITLVLCVIGLSIFGLAAPTAIGVLVWLGGDLPASYLLGFLVGLLATFFPTWFVARRIWPLFD